MTTKIYLIRHAEAEGNLYRRAQGQYDSLLTARAEKQIEALGRRFENVHLDAVYTSDLYRARETVRLLAQKKGLEPQTAEELREINMGAWENRPWGEIPLFWGKEYLAFQNTPWDFHIPGGESADQVTGRMLAFIRRIAKERPGQTVAAASHGCALRYLLCAAMGLPAERMKEVGMSDNTGVSLLEVEEDGSVKVVFRNDGSHLSEELSTFCCIRKELGEDRENGYKKAYMYFLPWNIELAEDLENFCNEAVMGNDELFARMRRDVQKNPLNLWFGFVDSRPMGLIWATKEENEAPRIQCLYVRPEGAGKNFEAQLIGQLIMTLRDREQLRLLAEPSEDRRAFYEKMGFREEEGKLALSIAVPAK